MEALGTVDTLVLDKTGSFTFGEPYVGRVTPCPGMTPQGVLELAAIVEHRSKHPPA
jgi:cation transport ATPase